MPQTNFRAVPAKSAGAQEFHTLALGPPRQDDGPLQTGLPSGPTICFQLSWKVATAFAGIGM